MSSLQNLVNDFVARLPYIIVALLVLILFYVLAKGVRALVRRIAQRSKRHGNLGLVLGRLAQFSIILLGLLVALVIALPNFTPGRLVELLGLTSVAIGFAFRDILQNFLAGILILLTEPFRIGDQIIFKNFEGTVEDIQTRATFITTYDGRRVVIPNAELFTNAVLVNTAFGKHRLEYDVGIGYGDDVATAKRLMLEAVSSVQGVLSDPAPDALVVALAGSSVNVRVRWWIEPPTRADALTTQDQVIAAIKQKVYVEHGIDLPYPTQQTLLHDQTEATDGDRARQREGWPAGEREVPQPRGIATTIGRLADVRAQGITPVLIGDRGFARSAILQWCEQHRLGLSGPAAEIVAHCASLVSWNAGPLHVGPRTRAALHPEGARHPLWSSPTVYGDAHRHTAQSARGRAAQAPHQGHASAVVSADDHHVDSCPSPGVVSQALVDRVDVSRCQTASRLDHGARDDAGRLRPLAAGVDARAPSDAQSWGEGAHASP